MKVGCVMRFERHKYISTQSEPGIDQVIILEDDQDLWKGIHDKEDFAKSAGDVIQEQINMSDNTKGVYGVDAPRGGFNAINV